MEIKKRLLNKILKGVKINKAMKDTLKKCLKELSGIKTILGKERELFIPLIKKLIEETSKANNLFKNINDKLQDDSLLSVPEVAKLLNVDRKTIYNFIKDKKLKVIKLSDTAFRIKYKDLQDFILDRTFPKK